MANQMRLTKWLAASLLAVFVFGVLGCSPSPREQVVSFQGLTMGTSFSMKWVAADDSQLVPVRREAGALLARINQQMSTYIDDSELSRLNLAEAGQLQTISPELQEVLLLAAEISDLTSGAFDVTVGPLVNLWGFGPDGRITHQPDQAEVDRLRSKVGYQYVHIDPANSMLMKEHDQYIDLSAIAKGYGVDQLAELLESHGIQRYLVEIGGELRVKGVKPGGEPWRLAIEAPHAGAREVQQVISIEQGAVATSGDYRNYFEEDGVRYSHTIDPRTAYPIRHRLASVTVITDTCAEADALATALMVMGEEQGYNFALEQGIKALFISKADEGFVTRFTPGFAPYLQASIGR
ncbi:FAD:protein FMN transferase [Marinobacterium sediminicola]|uniref:FAD:protein FMN transferase n=1 Tax=Marinobacterium sediminicola TaxID=518898 RepID=A0ABY1RX98_9GAMM|nr:FAD:protein FMN transferase [Marinobacterium sediminicola]ULG67851.1 FAD:protein FMN transferase [Marinobacterium sediminicola]SMR71467.1 thiamine biosynthesis lipoprotein [Marinobacterium sediminicola]